MAVILQKLQTSQEVDDVYRFISTLGHIADWSTYSRFILQMLGTAAQGGFCRHKHVCDWKERDRDRDATRGK